MRLEGRCKYRECLPSIVGLLTHHFHIAMISQHGYLCRVRATNTADVMELSARVRIRIQANIVIANLTENIT